MNASPHRSWRGESARAPPFNLSSLEATQTTSCCFPTGQTRIKDDTEVRARALCGPAMILTTEISFWCGSILMCCRWTGDQSGFFPHDGNKMLVYCWTEYKKVSRTCRCLIFIPYTKKHISRVQNTLNVLMEHFSYRGSHVKTWWHVFHIYTCMFNRFVHDVTSQFGFGMKCWWRAGSDFLH